VVEARWVFVKAMTTYRELIHNDHTPDMVGAPYAYRPYAAMLQFLQYSCIEQCQSNRCAAGGAHELSSPYRQGRERTGS
jgi:hypothetical protein